MTKYTPIEIKPNPNIPALAPGYNVKVHLRVVEGDRVRTQIFQGVVIGTRAGVQGNFTVRRVAYGVGVERVFPFNSPAVEKVEIMRIGKVRRARLYYLRGLSGKAARLKEKRLEFAELVGTPQAEEEMAPVAEGPAETPDEEAAGPEAAASQAQASVAEAAPPPAASEPPRAEIESSAPEKQS